MGFELTFNLEDNSAEDVTGSTFVNTNNFYIGTKRSADGEWLNGSITGVEVYNRALTALEIQKLYDQGRKWPT